jgi:hypothetical protein
VPTLVLAGEKSPEQLRNAARAIAGVLPNAEHRELEGQSHNPSMKVMAPVLAEFLSDALTPAQLPWLMVQSGAADSIYENASWNEACENTWRQN